MSSTGTSDAIAVMPIPREQIGALWPALLPFAEKLAARFPDDWPVAELHRQATEGELVLWLAYDSAALTPLALMGTDLFTHPSGRRSLRVRMTAGEDHSRWARVAERVAEDHARANGCARIEMDDARDGWARALPDYRRVRPVDAGEGALTGQAAREPSG
jgi:hypothetical protein